MSVIFFLIRLPFFLIGIILLLLIPIVILDIMFLLAVGFGPIVLPLAAAGFLVVIILVFIGAAFANRADLITSFFKEIWKWIGDIWKEFDVMGLIRKYLKLYVDLFRWLVGVNTTK